MSAGPGSAPSPGSPSAPRAGMAITVTGPVRPGELGPSLLHEHVICDMRTLMSDAGRRVRVR